MLAQTLYIETILIFDYAPLIIHNKVSMLVTLVKQPKQDVTH